MTREEAIKQIEEFMVIDDWSLVYLPDLHDALELAIEALTENESLAKTVIEASELLRKQRQQGTCKTCKHYVPYREQFSYRNRGDGYCKSTITNSDGQAYINCHDEWYCANYEKAGEKE